MHPKTGDDIPGLDYKELQEKSGKTFMFIKPHLEKQTLQVLQSRNLPIFWHFVLQGLIPQKHVALPEEIISVYDNFGLLAGLLF